MACCGTADSYGVHFRRLMCVMFFAHLPLWWQQMYPTIFGCSLLEGIPPVSFISVMIGFLLYWLVWSIGYNGSAKKNSRLLYAYFLIKFMVFLACVVLGVLVMSNKVSYSVGHHSHGQHNGNPDEFIPMVELMPSQKAGSQGGEIPVQVHRPDAPQPQGGHSQGPHGDHPQAPQSAGKPHGDHHPEPKHGRGFSVDEPSHPSNKMVELFPAMKVQPQQSKQEPMFAAPSMRVMVGCMVVPVIAFLVFIFEVTTAIMALVHAKKITNEAANTLPMTTAPEVTPAGKVVPAVAVESNTTPAAPQQSAPTGYPVPNEAVVTSWISQQPGQPAYFPLPTSENTTVQN